MRILFIGDVVGRSGREAVAAALPRLREALRIDLAVVNAENASHGFGLSPDMATALFAAGADVITLGNHAWDRKEIIPYIAETPRLLRPLNFPPGTPGAGSSVVEVGRRPPRAGAAGDGAALHGPARLPVPRHRRAAGAAPAGRHGGGDRRGLPRRGVEREDGVRAFPRRPGIGGDRHPHALPLGRCPGAAGRDGVPVGCRHVGRLRQRDRHGEGRGDAAVLAQDAGRAAGAGGG